MGHGERKNPRRTGLGRTQGGRRRTSQEVDIDQREASNIGGRRSPGNSRRKDLLNDSIEKFWSYGKDLQDKKKFKAALSQLLKEFRKNLDDSSTLAKSIDNKDSSTTMVKVAVGEDYFELAEILLLDSKE